MLSTKIRTTIIALVASASFAGASLAPVGASVAPASASAAQNPLVQAFLDGFEKTRPHTVELVIGPITVTPCPKTGCPE